jgi:hypothetical protein
MAEIKTCDIPRCTLPARTVTVAVDTVNDAGNAIGVSYAIDVCDSMRDEQAGILFARCLAEINMAA